MLSAVKLRAAVAITLMGVLLLAVGTCVLPAQHATHNCCAHMSMPCQSVNAGCCTATPRVPPAPVVPIFSGLAAMDVAQEFLPANGSFATRELLATPVTSPQSPPPGTFILRI